MRPAEELWSGAESNRRRLIPRLRTAHVSNRLALPDLVPHAVLTDGGGDEENATELQPLHLLAVAFSLLQWLPTVCHSRCMS